MILLATGVIFSFFLFSFKEKQDYFRDKELLESICGLLRAIVFILMIKLGKIHGLL